MSIDKDRTVIETIKHIYTEESEKYKLYFANGGDQTNELIPEKLICEKLSIKMIDNLGDKIQSSSWLLKK